MLSIASTAFTKAGGRQLYLVMGLLDLPNQPAIVATVTEGADVNVIEKLFAPTPLGAGGEDKTGPSAEQIGQVVVVAPPATASM